MAGWYQPDEYPDAFRYVPVALPAPAPGEDLALVAYEAIEAALGARQDEIARIGFACADRGLDAGWVVGYMNDG